MTQGDMEFCVILRDFLEFRTIFRIPHEFAIFVTRLTTHGTQFQWPTQYVEKLKILKPKVL